MINVEKLFCGAVLIVERNDGVESVSMTCLLPCGDAYDPSDRLGRAAMWSELLLRGAGELDSRAQADAFDRVGAVRSSDNGRVFVRLGATCLGSRLGETIPLIAQMIRRPLMTPESVEASREIALQAIASLEDDPQHRATLAVRARHLPDPLGRSGYGDEPGLRALTRDELVEGWERCALPVGSIIAISGAVDADPVRAALDRELDGWAGETEAFAIDDSPQRGYAHEDDDGEQVQILMAHDAPPAGTSETMKQRLLTAVLSGGMSGRLFTEVRERRGLCYSVSASYSADRDFGVVSAYVGTTPERAQESLDVLNDEMRKIGSPGSEITRDEYDRARVGLKSRLVFSGESTSARAGSLAGDWYRLGRTRTLEERAAEVDAVSLEELNAYAAGLDMGRLTIQTVGPRALTPPA